MEFYSFGCDLTANQFVGHDDGSLEQQKQNSHALLSKKSHISSDLKENQPSLQRPRILRNWEKGMEFLSGERCSADTVNIKLPGGRAVSGTRPLGFSCLARTSPTGRDWAGIF